MNFLLRNYELNTAIQFWPAIHGNSIFLVENIIPIASSQHYISMSTQNEICNMRNVALDSYSSEDT